MKPLGHKHTTITPLLYSTQQSRASWPHLPTIEVQGGELAKVGVRHVHIEGLRLIDVGASVCGHVHKNPLLDLPYRLVQPLEALRHV